MTLWQGLHPALLGLEHTELLDHGSGAMEASGSIPTGLLDTLLILMAISTWQLAMVGTLEYGEPIKTMENRLVLEAQGLSANTMVVAVGQVYYIVHSKDNTRLLGNN